MKLSFYALFVFLISSHIFGNDLDKKNIEQLIDIYFKSWSEADMNSYKSCFHPKAIIHFNNLGNISESKLDEFVSGQAAAHESSPSKMKEIPLSKKIIWDNDTAQVTVRWKLTAENRESYGYDFFTLTKLKNKWKITYLIFQND